MTGIPPESDLETVRQAYKHHSAAVSAWRARDLDMAVIQYLARERALKHLAGETQIPVTDLRAILLLAYRDRPATTTP